MPGRDVIVVGGSAGSLGPLTTVLQGLPRSFQSCVVVVVHRSKDSSDGIARVLARSSPIRVSVARDGHAIEPGVFVAPPDHHVVITPGRMHVTAGPKENGFRPAIDPLFRTAANAYGERVIGVVLSGGLDDGASGLREIKARNGLAIVQDPDDADVNSMPRSAIGHVDVDHVLPASAIATLLCREAGSRPEGDVAMDESRDDPQLPGVKTDIARMNALVGRPSGLTCPDCGGALWQIQDGRLVRFQCHVGHRYSPESLVMRQDDVIENALWSAVRALEERADLRRRMANQTEAAGLLAVSMSLTEQADTADQQADQIRSLLLRPGEGVTAEPAGVRQAEVPRRRKRPRRR
jgi:two-component system chemotaxis response regulator CheB